MWDGMWHMGDGGLGWGIGMLVMAVFWIALAVALVWITRTVWDRTAAREGPRPETPREILERRYARGEIDRAEFEEKRRDLS